MILLTFAHRGEAGSFFETGGFEPVAFPVTGLYRSKTAFLLITGEGVHNAVQSTAAVCGAFFEQICGVVNLGIAGSLEDTVTTGQIYPVRTCYLEDNGQMGFKSFCTASFQDPGARDCVSASGRALSVEDRERLVRFAPMVDREAWAVASVCNLFGMAFSAYKLISDRVGSGQEVVAEQIRQAQSEHSRRLLAHFRTVEALSGAEPPLEPIPLGDDFYFTASQRRRYAALTKALQLKLGPDTDMASEIPLEEIRAANLLPKQRTSLLLEVLGDLVNPFNARLAKRLDHLTAPLEKAGGRVSFARDYEDETLHLAATISDRDQLERLIQALRSLPHDDILALLRGEIDV